MTIDLANLVDSERGLVSRRLFADPAVYDLELQHVFSRCWLFLGHESQIARPGDFVQTRMGNEPVILTRNPQGEIRAFINSCRHRGNRVCRVDQGRTSRFMCAYHGWTYDLDGKLVSVPGFEDRYYSELDRDQWGLIPVAQLATYKGLIFGTFDPDAVPLEEYLGEARWALDYVLDQRAGGTEVVGGVFKWIIKSNWKLGADNIMGDNYHGGVTHKSATMVGHQTGQRFVRERAVPASGGAINPQAPVEVGRPVGLAVPAIGVIASPLAVQAITPSPLAGEGGGEGEQPSAREPRSRLGFTAPLDWGHGLMCDLVPEGQARVRGGDAIGDYYRSTLPEMRERLGDLRARVWKVNFTVFPNASFTTGSNMLHVWHPLGPTATEVWLYVIVDKEAPEDVKQQIRRLSQRHFSPAGMFEQDDMDNWEQSTEAAAGMIARDYPLHYAMGIGHEAWATGGEVSRRMDTIMDESNQRAFYRGWAEFMSGKSWDALRRARQRLEAE